MGALNCAEPFPGFSGLRSREQEAREPPAAVPRAGLEEPAKPDRRLSSVEQEVHAGADRIDGQVALVDRERSDARATARPDRRRKAQGLTLHVDVEILDPRGPTWRKSPFDTGAGH